MTWFGLCNGIPGSRSNQMFELPEGMCCFPDKWWLTTEPVIRIYSTPTYIEPLNNVCTAIRLILTVAKSKCSWVNKGKKSALCVSISGVVQGSWHCTFWFLGVIYGTAVTCSSIVWTVGRLWNQTSDDGGRPIKFLHHGHGPGQYKGYICAW